MRNVAFAIALTPLTLLLVACFLPARRTFPQAEDFVLACFALALLQIAFSAAVYEKFSQIISEANKRDSAFLALQTLPAILAFPAFVLSNALVPYALVCTASIAAIIRSETLMRAL